MKRIALFIILTLALVSSSAQCLDKIKIKLGGDFGFYDYIFHCPSYQFSYNGDKSSTWSILNPIDIEKIADVILPIKTQLENEIIEYAGEEFFSHLSFYSVDISYPDSINKFEKGNTQEYLTLCKAKYFFYYYFVPIDSIKYCIGIALNESYKIISKLNFPSKKEYAPIDKSLGVCKVIELARLANNDIDPIEEVSFEYDENIKKFYWLIKQKIVNPTEGDNEYNAVVIDAANSKKVNTIKRHSFIVY